MEQVLINRRTHSPSANGGVSVCRNRTIFEFVGNCGIQPIKIEYPYSDRSMKNGSFTIGLRRPEVEIRRM